MIMLLGFSFLAGLVTVLSPCILPVLPFLLSGGATGGRKRPLGIISGFIASFTFFTLTLSVVVRATQVPADYLRGLAAALLAVFGIVLLIPALKNAFESTAVRFVPKFSAQGSANKSGFIPGFAMGMSLGLVWTPCVGPILASVMTLAASKNLSMQAVFITLAYSLGTAIPMFVIMMGQRRIFEGFKWFKTNSAKIQKVFGALIILTSFSIIIGLDRKFETWVTERFPSYVNKLISIDERSLVHEKLNELEETD